MGFDIRVGQCRAHELCGCERGVFSGPQCCLACTRAVCYYDGVPSRSVVAAERQAAVVKLAQQNWPTKVIAAELGLAKSTVERYRRWAGIAAPQRAQQRRLP